MASQTSPRKRRAPGGMGDTAITELGPDGLAAGSNSSVARKEKAAEDSRPSGLVKAATIARRIVLESLPAWLAVGAMLGLIFGGCCSNVYALEAIVKVEPASGTLLTFVQFLFVAVTGYVSQFDRSRPPLFIRPNVVPIRRWLINIVLFFSINVLNNHAFSYDISVPVHIILRSAGPITTLVAGWLYGKKYTRVQVVAVVLMTAGVVVAAWSDAQTKGNASTDAHVDKPSFGIGLLVLFTALVLSSAMGLYTEATYRIYGPQWRENLFYSHLLSLPLFLPFAPGLISQFRKLAQSPALQFAVPDSLPLPLMIASMLSRIGALHVPSQLAYLAANVLTQYACIRGVNLLAAASSALTVVIVLNIRKLVSLLLSIWLFGNRLAAGTLLGAVLVFGSAGLYSLDRGAVPEKAKPK